MRSEYEANQHLQSRVQARQQSQAWMQPAKHAQKRRAAKHRKELVWQVLSTAVVVVPLTLLVAGWIATH